MVLSNFLKISAIALAVKLTALAQSAEPSTKSSVKLERWTGISGKAISLLTSSPDYPWNPSETIYLDSFEDVPRLSNYGSRLRAFLTIPQSGDYTFYISGDDNVQLFLNPSGSDYRTKELIASHQGWSGLRQWDKYATQKSQTFTFKAGQKLYIEALQKEGGGEDSVSVGWMRPGVSEVEVIDGQFLEAFEYDLAENRNALSILISEAEGLLKNSSYGNQKGEFSLAVKANLLNDLDQARIKLSNPSTDADAIAMALYNLDFAIQNFLPH